MTTTASTPTISSHQLEQALHQVEPAVVLAPPRLIRRVIRQDRGVASLLRQPPHRKSYVISAKALHEYVDPEELGLEADHNFCTQVILLTRPRPEKVQTMPAGQLLQEYWRLLYHARIDAHMAGLVSAGRLTPAAVVERVHAIGQAAFDEIRSVLDKERFLLPPADNVAVYCEFVAVYLELKHFVPRALGVYFPAIESFERIDRVIALDIDGDALLHASRLTGADDPAAVVTGDAGAMEPLPYSPPFQGGAGGGSSNVNGSTTASGNVTQQIPLPHPPLAPASKGGEHPAAKSLSPQDAAYLYDKLLHRADKASAVGNHARAATLRNRAVSVQPEDPMQARAGCHAEISKLTARLQKVLAFDDMEGWTDAIAALLEPEAVGWRTPGARIIYDLQAVCIDHEREVFKFDLVGWATSLGQTPIKRSLPTRRDVRLHQHLSTALTRLQKAPFAAAIRQRLMELLEPRLHVVEHRMRDALRPKIEQAVDASGLMPVNPPEQLARRKLVEELLDRIVERGFINMSDVRDAISRNDLKLPDVRGVGAFLHGDPLLKIDKALAKTLDGVYRRGEVYRRWPQRLSSLAFGTPVGRWITRFIALPYLGAYLTLEMVQHIVHMFVHAPKEAVEASHHRTAYEALSDAAAHAMAPLLGPQAMLVSSSTTAGSSAIAAAAQQPVHLVTWLSVLIVGTALLWLMHAPTLRRAVFNVIRWIAQRFYGVVVELPGEVLRLPFVRKVVNNRPARIVYRHLIKPAFFGVIVWLLLHTIGADFGIAMSNALLMFLLVNLLLNTRAGHNIEEVAADWVTRLWRWLGVRVLAGVVRWIVDAFKWVLDAFEEVLYNIDEWLRFRTGESRLTIAGKVVAGTLWFFVAYFVSFMITLLIEPQVNPVKHFPVVTVSHKVMLGLMPAIVDILLPLFNYDRKQAYTVVGSVIWLVPGVFGYIAWELKENWRLYRANRSATLKPVIIGHHGETMLRLLKPGVHSGTVPKLFAKLRRIERKRAFKPADRAERKHRLALHHVEEAVTRFVERELLWLLHMSRSCRGLELKVDHVHLGGNSIRVCLTPLPLREGRGEGRAQEVIDGQVALPAPPSPSPSLEGRGVKAQPPHSNMLDAAPAEIVFEEQSGWLLASIEEPGWISRLSNEQLDTLKACLSGFYKLAAVDIVREQLEAVIDVDGRPYDVDDRGLVVWPAQGAEPAAVYPLVREAPANGQGTTTEAGAEQLPAGRPPRLFRHDPVAWDRWVQAWQTDQAGETAPTQLTPAPDLVRIDRRA